MKQFFVGRHNNHVIVALLFCPLLSPYLLFQVQCGALLPVPNLHDEDVEIMDD